MKNSYFLRSILLFTFISFLICTSTVNGNNNDDGKNEDNGNGNGAGDDDDTRCNVCGVAPLMRNKPDTTVVGEKNAEFGAWPWQVVVGSTSLSYICSGVIINENWIVTTARCVNLWSMELVIHAGTYDIFKDGPLPIVEKRVVQIFTHPQYNPNVIIYDIAMLKLESPLKYAPHIMPICLPESDDLLVGKTATVTQWLQIWENGSFPTILQEASVPILSNNECKSILSKRGSLNPYLPDEWLCAGFENNTKSGCESHSGFECDSGGPLQVKHKDGRYFLAGIVHGRRGCSPRKRVAIYMRISKFLPWILEIITQN